MINIYFLQKKKIVCIYIYIHTIELPEECGHPLTIRNRPVALNR